jgi:hypothetical protein
MNQCQISKFTRSDEPKVNQFQIKSEIEMNKIDLSHLDSYTQDLRICL